MKNKKVGVSALAVLFESLFKGGPGMAGKPKSHLEFGKRRKRKGSMSSGKRRQLLIASGRLNYCPVGYTAGFAKRHKKIGPSGPGAKARERTRKWAELRKLLGQEA